MHGRKARAATAAGCGRNEGLFSAFLFHRLFGSASSEESDLPEPIPKSDFQFSSLQHRPLESQTACSLHRFRRPLARIKGSSLSSFLTGCSDQLLHRNQVLRFGEEEIKPLLLFAVGMERNESILNLHNTAESHVRCLSVPDDQLHLHVHAGIPAVAEHIPEALRAAQRASNRARSQRRRSLMYTEQRASERAYNRSYQRTRRAHMTEAPKNT
ncbi:hypothetical protein KSP39_PZI007186 [Platanthera zijinensis]|uniref:Uncharacterized protein n=1 Tax=Platanthera zijinensis TaxID=2320716 RepID=A0AAP0BS79_9ASPA